jgi:hypothetical protein
MTMLTLGQLLKATQSASQRGSGRSVSERASKVSISGVKTGFRDGWKVPDTAYWGSPGVQEVLFVTQASDSKTDRRFRKPYQTMYRFPLDQTSGSPYAPGASANDLPVWVNCTCPAFRYYSEVALTKQNSSDVIESDGSLPTKNNPQMEPYICKHLFATAKMALDKRRTIGVTASTHTLQEDPLKPKRRDPEKVVVGTPKSQKGRKTPDVSATAANPTTMPQTWLGRLGYILFNAKQGR